MRLQGHLELRPAHRELLELHRHAFLQAARRRRARLGQLVGQLGAAARGLLQIALELSGPLLGALDPLDLAPAAIGMGEHGLDRAPVLALEAVDDVESLLDLLQAARLPLDPLGVGPQLRGQLLHLDRDRPGTLGERVEGRVHSLLARQRRLGHRHRLRGAALAVVAGDRRDGLRCRPPQGLGMAQPLPLRGQLGLLGGIRLGRLDLGELEAEDVEVALTVSLPLADLGELALDRGDLGMGLAVAGAPLQVLLAGEPVQRLQLRRGEGQLAVLVLAVEGEQPRAERPQLRRGGRAALQEGRGPARGRDAPSQHDLARVLGQALGDLRQLGIVEQPGRELEHALDVGLRGARPHDLGPRLPAHDQVQRVGQDRLAGAGLPRDRVQARPEAELGPLDQEQVLDPQLEEHALVVRPRADGLGAYEAGGHCASRPNFSRSRV